MNWSRPRRHRNPGALPETLKDAAEASGRHPELLSNEGSPGSGRSHEWEHQVANTSRAGIPEPALPALYKVFCDRVSGATEHGARAWMRSWPAPGAFEVVVAFRFDHFAGSVKQLVLALE